MFHYWHYQIVSLPFTSFTHKKVILGYCCWVEDSVACIYELCNFEYQFCKNIKRYFHLSQCEWRVRSLLMACYLCYYFVDDINIICIFLIFKVILRRVCFQYNSEINLAYYWT